jgi:uncharacterized protein
MFAHLECPAIKIHAKKRVINRVGLSHTKNKEIQMSGNNTSFAGLNIATAEQISLDLLPALANRHGLITGATGTGKTVSLQVLAEKLSSIGVPCFMADVKGDLSGISQAGQLSPKLKERLDRLKLPEPIFQACPTTLWDVFGEKGHPVRATVSDMGPLMLSRILNLNDVQEGVLHLVFRIADERGLLLLDAKDLRAMLQFVGENAKDLTTEYGNVSAASIGAIQRSLLALDEQGADQFFGEPMLNLQDMMQTIDGKGVINVLTADRLLNAPRLYGTFLLWMLSELFETLPEVGDLAKPKFVFFFDEAHLLFNEAPANLLNKIEQIVRLVRSKGVGVYFVTQNPLDIPDTVLGQLGNRIQHALRAFTPRDQKAVQTAAETMRANPKFDTVQAISELAVGEALISFLDDKGRPCIVERAFINPPGSRIGPLSDDERKQVIASSIVAGVYDKTIDRDSAYEKIKGRVAKNSGTDARNIESSKEVEPNTEVPTKDEPSLGDRIKEQMGGVFGDNSSSRGSKTSSSRKDTVLDSFAKSAARSIGSTVGRAIIRGVLGSILKR